MTSKEFEQKLKKINEGFSIVPNPHRLGLGNIMFNGQNYDLPVVSMVDIRDVPDSSYRYEFPNGMSARMNSVEDIMPRIEHFLKMVGEGSLQENYE